MTACTVLAAVSTRPAPKRCTRHSRRWMARCADCTAWHLAAARRPTGQD